MCIRILFIHMLGVGNMRSGLMPLRLVLMRMTYKGECGSLIQNSLHKLIYLNTWSQLVEIFGRFRQCGPCWRRCVTKGKLQVFKSPVHSLLALLVCLLLHRSLFLSVCLVIVVSRGEFSATAPEPWLPACSRARRVTCQESHELTLWTLSPDWCLYKLIWLWYFIIIESNYIKVERGTQGFLGLSLSGYYSVPRTHFLITSY